MRYLSLNTAFLIAATIVMPVKAQETIPSDKPYDKVIPVVINRLEKCFSTKLKAIYAKTVDDLPWFNVINRAENRKVMDFSIAEYKPGVVYSAYVQQNGTFVLQDEVDLKNKSDDAHWGIDCVGGTEE